jgi:hypothetical protein
MKPRKYKYGSERQRSQASLFHLPLEAGVNKIEENTYGE